MGRGSDLIGPFDVEAGPSWSLDGNDIDDTTDFLGSTTLDQNVRLSVNSTFGGQIDMLVLDANNTVFGDSLVDFGGAGAMRLPLVVGAVNTIMINFTENFLSTLINFEMNNDQGGNIRTFQLSTSDVGTFGQYQFILGVGAQDNQLLAGGVFPFRFTNGGLDQPIVFSVNDGGSDFDLMEIDPNGPQSQPQVNYHGLFSVLDGESVTYGTSPFDIMAVNPTVNTVNVNPTTNTCFNSASIWNFTATQTGIFNGTTGFNAATRVLLTNATNSYAVRSIIAQAISQGQASTDLTQAQGLLAQAGVQGGNVQLAVGVIGSCLTVFSGNIDLSIGVQANAFIPFLGGTCDESVSLRSVGGTSAVINWNGQFTNDVPSFHEGNWLIGAIVEFDATKRLQVSGDQRTTGEVVYQDKFESSKMDIMAA